MKLLYVAVFTMLSNAALAKPTTDIVCSYAPSQSKAVAAVSGAAGGATVTAGAIAAATGLTAVVHSSGALILTGASGYIAGTLGTTAAAVAAAPVVVAVGLVVGGAAVSIELVCASKNHPDQVAKVEAAAGEFSRRFSETMQMTRVAAAHATQSIRPAAGRTALKAKKITSDVWQYVYKTRTEVGSKLTK